MADPRKEPRDHRRGTCSYHIVAGSKKYRCLTNGQKTTIDLTAGLPTPYHVNMMAPERND